jgi:hypothetical protein
MALLPTPPFPPKMIIFSNFLIPPHSFLINNHLLKFILQKQI